MASFKHPAIKAYVEGYGSHDNPINPYTEGSVEHHMWHEGRKHSVKKILPINKNKIDNHIKDVESKLDDAKNITKRVAGITAKLNKIKMRHHLENFRPKKINMIFEKYEL